MGQEKLSTKSKIIMSDIYVDGKYLEATKTWHAEDSQWKASQIEKIITKNQIYPMSIAEIGCGSGKIIEALSDQDFFEGTDFKGYDISPQSIKLCQQLENDKLRFFLENLLSETNNDYFDILLVIDVFEHVRDYMSFLDQCCLKARYKIYHIPLDIHVSSVLRNKFITSRYDIGHLHYFTAESALSTLKDTGHEILDYCYTDVAIGLYKEHPSAKKAVANIARFLLSKYSVSLAARLFGGYSLLVLTK
jgi:hypothetical protein